ALGELTQGGRIAMRTSRFSLSRSFVVVVFLTLVAGPASAASQILVADPATARAPAGPDVAAADPSAAGVPESWLSQVQESIASSEYEISPQAALPAGGRSAAGTRLSTEEAGWQAPNRAQNFQIQFTRAGLHVAPLETPGPSGGNGAVEAVPWSGDSRFFA